MENKKCTDLNTEDTEFVFCVFMGIIPYGSCFPSSCKVDIQAELIKNIVIEPEQLRYSIDIKKGNPVLESKVNGEHHLNILNAKNNFKKNLLITIFFS